MKARLWIGLTICLSAVSFTRADEEPIATDRPDFVESSDTVGKGHIQIETSFQRESTVVESENQDTTTMPTLLRIGVAKDWEARYETDGYSMVQVAGTKQKGINDAALGFKWHSMDGQGLKPGMSWLFHLDIASGARGFSGRGTRPSLRTVGEWELPFESSLGIMPGLMWDYDEAGDGYLKGIAAIVAGHSWCKRFRTFVEVSGQELRSTRHGGNVATFDAGGAVLVTQNIQIDSAASWGMNSYTPDLSWTVGVSVRL